MQTNETKDEATQNCMMRSQRRKELISELKHVMGLWVLETILMKKKYCYQFPDLIGKTKEELSTFSANITYWTLQDYFHRFHQTQWQPSEQSHVPEEVKQALQGEVIEIQEERIPCEIGITIIGERLYILSLNENERVKDAFYIPIEDDIFKTFPLYQQIILEGTLVELDVMELGSTELEEDMNFIIRIFKEIKL